MTAKQRRYERTVIAYLTRLEAKIDAVCKAAGIDPDTLIDLDTLQAVADNAIADEGMTEAGEEVPPEPVIEPVAPPVEVKPKSGKAKV